MPGLAIIGTMNTAAAPLTLTLGGVSVLRDQTAGGFGVPLESIEVDELGPGGVSSMTFQLDDPAQTITLAAGQDVRYLDVVNGWPIFTGFLQSWTVRVVGLGRRYSIRCVGLEALLDWLRLTATLTIPAGTKTVAAIQMVASAATSIGFDLRWAGDSTLANGDQPTPVGSLGFPVVTGVAVVLDAGSTLREGIRKVLEAIPANIAGSGYGVDTSDGVATIDFYAGLRVFRRGGEPIDYATLIVADTVAGPNPAAELEHETDLSGVVRAVYITGGNALGSGLVTDGTGIPGPVATLDDSTILTAVDLRAAGIAYLSDKAPLYRGTLSLLDNALATNVRAGSVMGLTDNETGATGTYQIGSIAKSWHGASSDWRITYGGLPPSAATLVRRLTRQTLG